MSALLLHRDETVLDEGHIPVGTDDRWAVSDQSCHVIAHRRYFNPNRRERIVGQHERVHA